MADYFGCNDALVVLMASEPKGESPFVAFASPKRLVILYSDSTPWPACQADTELAALFWSDA